MGDSRPTLKFMFRTFKDCGDTKVRVDRANADLIAEAIAMGASHRSWEDAQIIGRFHHYVVKEGNVEVELITTQPVSEEEAKAAAYAGYTLTEYRKMRAQWKNQ